MRCGVKRFKNMSKHIKNTRNSKRYVDPAKVLMKTFVFFRIGVVATIVKKTFMRTKI